MIYIVLFFLIITLLKIVYWSKIDPKSLKTEIQKPKDYENNLRKRYTRIT